MKVTYLTYKELPVGPNSGVIRTQVLDLLDSLKKDKRDLKVDWCCFIRQRDMAQYNNQFRDLASNYSGGSTFKINIIPLYMSYPVMAYGELFLHVVLHVLLKTPDILHCRSYITTFLANVAKKMVLSRARIIFDARGVYPEEQAQAHLLPGHSRHYKLLKVIERYNLRNSNVTVCVSHAMQEHYAQLVSKSNCIFIPPFVHCSKFNRTLDQRDNLRTSLGIPIERVVLLYSGSFDLPWSVASSYASFFQEIYSRFPDVLLLVLSNSDHRKIETFFKDMNVAVNNLKIISPNPEEIIQLTAVADYGLILRDDTMVNRVAFPIKFLEYVASGLPVIVTRSNYFISQLIDLENVGITYRPQEPRFLERFEHMLNNKDMRGVCRRFAARYDITIALKRYKELYLSLN